MANIDTHRVKRRGLNTLIGAFMAGILAVSMAPTTARADTQSEDTLSGTFTQSIGLTATQTTFRDVSPGAWYAKDVQAACGAGYISGYGNTNTFGPGNAIKRGDMAVILARMAGVMPVIDSPSTSHVKGFRTGFSDVDPNSYYAQSIQWCSRHGIIQGYSNSGLFKPEAPVTRQEFAVMLGRYAERFTGSQSASSSVLNKYGDASKVADWAKSYVAWAVDKEIMGVGTTVINPTNNITRAEAAAMAVRFQPKMLTNQNPSGEPIDLAVLNIDNATIKTSPTNTENLKPGQIVTITVTPNSGYTYSSVPGYSWSDAFYYPGKRPFAVTNPILSKGVVTMTVVMGDEPAVVEIFAPTRK